MLYWISFSGAYTMSIIKKVYGSCENGGDAGGDDDDDADAAQLS